MEATARFVKVQRDHNRVVLIVGAVMFAAGLACFIVLPADAPVVRTGLAAIFGLLGGSCLAWGMRKPANRPGIVAIRDTPQEIVWSYWVRESKNGRATGAKLMLGMVNGKVHSLPIEVGKEDEFQDLVASVAPTARYGYSDELQAQFKRDPKSLQG